MAGGNSIVERDFLEVKKLVYNVFDLIFTDPVLEEESSEYGACTFKVNNLSIKQRTAKITPKKVGQFVTLWKRNNQGITEPHDLSDSIDLYIINVRLGNQFGQFVFPKEELLKRGILSDSDGKGKRGFRVYPSWDEPTSKQAIKTQIWQLEYFLKLNQVDKLSDSLIKRLYFF